MENTVCESVFSTLFYKTTRTSLYIFDLRKRNDWSVFFFPLIRSWNPSHPWLSTLPPVSPAAAVNSWWWGRWLPGYSCVAAMVFCLQSRCCPIFCLLGNHSGRKLLTSNQEVSAAPAPAVSDTRSLQARSPATRKPTSTIYCSLLLDLSH